MKCKFIADMLVENVSGVYLPLLFFNCPIQMQCREAFVTTAFIHYISVRADVQGEGFTK